ncbi:MAG TPA: peptidylprolyl isomerase [Candidatus Cloacimonadota bacterium]|nr:peptidylprolyl isomerase [Candidatus Cloacimonadota bacterium]
MLEGMRKHASWIILIIAALFILSMAIGGISSIFMKNPYKYVGIVDGVKVTYPEYQEYLKNTYANYSQQNPDVEFDDKLTQQLNDQTWNSLKQRILYDREIKKRHIKVKDNDVIESLQNPPDDIKSIEQLQTDGVFDTEKYNNLLFENRDFAAYMESRIRSSMPYDKLFESVKAEVKLTDEDVKEQYIKDNNKADADIIYFETKLAGKTEITDEDIKAYYDAHLEDYKRGPASKYKYIRIELKPSEADRQVAKAKSDSIYQEAIHGADFADLAREFSQDSTAPNGGELGYFVKGKMAPEFEETAFAMNVGDIGEPVETGYGWHVIKVTGKKVGPEGQPMVEASHILIKNTPSEETKQNQEIMANDVYAKARKVGLQKAGEELSYEVVETREFYQDAKYITGLGQDEGQVAFAFKHKIGSLLEPFLVRGETYVVAEVSFKAGDHYQDLSEVEAQIRRKVDTEKKMEMVNEIADKFVAENTPDTYMAAAQKQDIKIVNATDITADNAIAGIRMDSALNEAILAKEDGECTGLVKGEFGAYIAFVKNHIKPDMDKFEAEKDELFNTTLTKKQDEYLNNWYSDLMDNAQVTDNRHLFFNQ